MKYSNCWIQLDCEKQVYRAVNVEHRNGILNKFENHFDRVKGHINEGQVVGKPYLGIYCRLFKKYILPENK